MKRKETKGKRVII